MLAHTLQITHIARERKRMRDCNAHTHTKYTVFKAYEVNNDNNYKATRRKKRRNKNNQKNKQTKVTTQNKIKIAKRVNRHKYMNT